MALREQIGNRLTQTRARATSRAVIRSASGVLPGITGIHAGNPRRMARVNEFRIGNTPGLFPQYRKCSRNSYCTRQKSSQVKSHHDGSFLLFLFPSCVGCIESSWRGKVGTTSSGDKCTADSGRRQAEARCCSKKRGCREIGTATKLRRSCGDRAE
ncbi:hypothetical protein C8R44DRAFT_728481 [Mycena epipterygia]|nr:hypothetical protein C8R44DRAFT_728481 [Mycena epipterygia]